MVTLETDRESDLDAYAEMCADPKVMRYIGDGQPLPRLMAWRNLALMVGHWSLRGYGLWAAEERSSGVLIGRIGFWNPDDVRLTGPGECKPALMYRITRAEWETTNDAIVEDLWQQMLTVKVAKDEKPAETKPAELRLAMKVHKDRP